MCSGHTCVSRETWMCLGRVRPNWPLFCLNTSFHPRKNSQMAKNLRMDQFEQDLQSQIERAFAHEWQSMVASSRSLPTSGRPKLVKLKFVLSFSVGVVMMVSVTSRMGSDLSEDAYSSVRIGLWKFNMPIHDLACFILNFDDFGSYVDEQLSFCIESETCRFTHGPNQAALLDDDDDDESENTDDNTDNADDNMDEEENVNGDSIKGHMSMTSSDEDH